MSTGLGNEVSFQFEHIFCHVTKHTKHQMRSDTVVPFKFPAISPQNSDYFAHSLVSPQYGDRKYVSAHITPTRLFAFELEKRVVDGVLCLYPKRSAVWHPRQPT